MDILKNKNTKESTKTIKKIIRFTLICMLIILAIDFFDLPSKLGIPVNKINIDVQSLIISNVIVIGIFLITYFLIDKRGIEREKKQKECALAFLNETIKECIENVEFVDNKDIRHSIVKNCKFDVIVQDDKVLNNLCTLPFKYDNFVFEAANNGLFTRELFKEYLNFEGLYRRYIIYRMTIFDAEEENRIDLLNPLNEKKEALISSINKIKTYSKETF